MEKVIDLSDLYQDISKKVHEIGEKICDFMISNDIKYIDFMNDKNFYNDAVYAYVYDEGDELREAKIVGLSLNVSKYGNSLNVHFIKPWDLEVESTAIFGGEILGLFTAMNIAEHIHEYKF